ncbi:hypothetical protein [Sphingobium indicum]|uniref:hypothetical protein n=1 Tax=Sphingobium indicum TaxID=332055 RepID=UPI0005612E0A|nr:hypothetical protein [Sphingobium indicum]
MPKASDWTDYIPASGEASVGLNLKGRYGGKGSNMRRSRFNKRSRFSRVPRRQRYWFPNYQGDLFESGWDALPAVATPVTIRSFNSGAAAVNSTSEPEDLSAQTLLLTQGPIFARLTLIQETPENPTPTQLGNHDHQFMMLSYFWSVDELDGNGSLDVPTSFEFSSPADGGSRTIRLLRRKDMLNWGLLPLYWENRLQMYGGDTTQVPNYHQDHSFPWTRIPPPRIPKGGIRLGNDRMVCLHTTIMNQELLSAAAVPWLDSEIYSGHFRWLLAK